MDVLKLAETYEVIFTTHNSAGRLADVDGDAAGITMTTYENAVDGSMYAPVVAQVQDGMAANVTGTYRVVIVATGANGFEAGKRYNVVETHDMGGIEQSMPVATFIIRAYSIDDLMTMIGTAVALDGGTASIAGMLTKMADDNAGGDFNAGTDSLHEQTHQIITIDGEVDSIKSSVGAPVVLDGALQTIAGMITALADDNGGADFLAHADSLHILGHAATSVVTNIGTPANIDGGGATLADNLKKLADDNGGLTFNAEYDSQNKISAKIGTPVALDLGTASVSGMLTKIADDNGGASFDATNDSLNKISDKVEASDAIVDDIETMLVTGSQNPDPVKFTHP